MATVEIRAHACSFETRPFRVLKFEPLAKPLATRQLDVSSVNQVQASMMQFAGQVALVHTGSLFVSVRLVAGRAPAGFRKTRFVAEIDRDTPRPKVSVTFQGQAHVHHLTVDVTGACWTYQVAQADYEAALAAGPNLDPLRTMPDAPDFVRTWVGPFAIEANPAALPLAA